MIRRRYLHHVDLIGRRDIWLTALPLTVLETAVALPDGSSFLDGALQRHARFPTAYRAYCRNLGSTGSSAAGRLLVAAADPRGLGRRTPARAPSWDPLRFTWHDLGGRPGEVLAEIGVTLSAAA